MAQDGLIQGYTVTVSTAQIQAQIQGEDKITSNELLILNKKKIELINRLQELDEKKKEMRANPVAAQAAQAGAPPPVLPSSEKINQKLAKCRNPKITETVGRRCEIVFAQPPLALSD